MTLIRESAGGCHCRQWLDALHQEILCLFDPLPQAEARVEGDQLIVDFSKIAAQA